MAFSLANSNFNLSPKTSKVANLVRCLGQEILDHCPSTMVEEKTAARKQVVLERFAPSKMINNCSELDQRCYIQMVRDQFILKHRLFAKREEQELTKGADPDLLVSVFEIILDHGCEGISQNIKGITAHTGEYSQLLASYSE